MVAIVGRAMMEVRFSTRRQFITFRFHCHAASIEILAR